MAWTINHNLKQDPDSDRVLVNMFRGEDWEDDFAQYLPDSAPPDLLGGFTDRLAAEVDCH